MKADGELAIGKAELWLKQNDRYRLPVDPKEIARSLDIEVQAKPGTEPGVSGMLLRHGEAFGILYATHIDSEGFQNFSIAHELGHYLLEGHPEALFPKGDGMHKSQAGFLSADQYEREADYFAAGLLMPSGPFRQALIKEDEGLPAIESLAAKCRTSLTATAIRWAKLTSVPAAVVMTTDNRIDWVFMSKALQEVDGLTWLRKGDPVPSGVPTDTFIRSPDNIRLGRKMADEVQLRDWFGGRAGVKADEDIIGLGSYGKTLTVLTVDLPDEDEDGDLEESWTPRFRGR